MSKTPEPIELEPLCDQPLISVLTPCYNAQEYIGETIESVLAQSYQNWQMVICDDGSTDASLDIIQEYTQKEDRVILVQQANAGAPAATNTAFNASTGEIIAFLDADDLFAANKLSECVRAFQKHPDRGFLTHRLQGIDHLGLENGTVFPGVPNLVDGWFAPYLFGIAPERGSAAPSAGNLVKREVLEPLMPIPLECQRTQDAYVLTCAMLMTPAIGLDQILGCYRVHPGGQSRGTLYTQAYHTRRLADQQATVAAVSRFCEQRGFEELVKYLKTDYFFKNAGFLDNAVVNYLLTGNVNEKIAGCNMAELITITTPRVRRLKPLLFLPVYVRRMALAVYRFTANITAPFRRKELSAPSNASK